MAKYLVFFALAVLVCMGLFWFRSATPIGPALERSSVESRPAAVISSPQENSARRAPSGSGQPLDVPSVPTFVVHVFDEYSADIESATVTCLSLSTRDQIDLATTNSRGITSSTLSLPYPLLLRVSSRGYTSAEFHLDRPQGTVFDVRLKASGAIFGQVVLGPSGIGVEGVRVLAWSQDLRVPAYDLAKRALEQADVRAVVTTSHANGQFELNGVNPAALYCLVAAGSGVASSATTCGVSPGKESIALQVGPLYGARVRVEPSAPYREFFHNLAPPAVNPVQAQRIAGAKYIYQPSFVSVLAGFDKELEYGSLSATTYLFVGDVEKDAIGPLDYSLSLLGYESVHSELMFPRATTVLSETVIKLKPSEPVLGRCTFRFVWADGLSIASTKMVGSLGRITLDRIGNEGGAGRVALNITSFKSPKWSLDVPFGKYEARYGCKATGATVPYVLDPAIVVDVGEAETTFDINMRATAGVEIEVHSERGQRLSGALSVMLIHGSPMIGSSSQGAPVSLNEPPYLIAPLMPGDYTISLLGHSSAPVTSRPVAFHASPGEVTKVVLSVESN